MKKQVKKYSAKEKARVAIEAITGEMTIAQITSKSVNMWFMIIRSINGKKKL